MTLPGFGGADGCMSSLRGWLDRWGYDARPWKLGRNFPNYRMSSLDDAMVFREKMVARAAQRIEAIYEETGQRLSLIGWSLGGLYACELAAAHPKWVRHAITLGTPHGDPRGTAAWNLLQRAYHTNGEESDLNIEHWVSLHRGRHHSVPVTVVYSPSDGVVASSVATLDDQENVEHYQVRSSHLGFAINPHVYWLIAKLLAEKQASH